MKPTPIHVDRVLLRVLDWYIWRLFGWPTIIAAALFFGVYVACWIARAAQ